MRFVAVKDEEQQASGVVFRARDGLVRQRTQCINALRGHLTEYGWVVPKRAFQRGLAERAKCGCAFRKIMPAKRVASGGEGSSIRRLRPRATLGPG
jgi:transposase